MSITVELPHWDMTVVYPGLESDEFERDFRELIAGIEDLRQLFDAAGVGRRSGAQVDDGLVQSVETVIDRYNELAERLNTIGVYIRSFITTDSFNDVAQARASELEQRSVVMDQLTTRLTAWVGSMDIDALLPRSEVARQHEFPLRKMQQNAAHQMEPGQEDLAAELAVSGGSSWGKLYSNVTARLMVSVEGEPAPLPMSVVRNMVYNPDRDRRRRGYEAELAAWEGVAVPLAAALNGIKGESNTVALRRGWGSVLDVALLINNIDREALDAMLDAARRSFPDFRRYLKIKARVLGLEALAWYDVAAPVGRISRRWDFEDAESFLVEQFGTFSEDLRRLAERAFRERWIDAEPRVGKVQGAFCMPLRADESRILSNYNATYESVRTLAHELGHAYHNTRLAGRTRLQRNYPMTLAETASIFNETIIMHAALSHADHEEQIAIVESALQSRFQQVVDITSRFEFERAVCERRLKRDLSVAELCELMLDAQRNTYGEGLDQAALHPYMWAAKGHYYRTARPFYNFPYMFGLLFGLGLYSRYQQDPASFRPAYDDFLASAGMADAAMLARRFGVDIRTPAFWTESLDVIRDDIAHLERLVSSRSASAS